MDHKLLLSYLYLRQGNIETAKKVNNDIISENPNSSLAVRAKLNNFNIALYNDNDVNAASAILKEIENKAELIIPMELQTAVEALYVFNSELSNNLNTMPKTTRQEEENKPGSYSLLGNYPNPFNPTTTISYNLPRMSDIELKIYDILGNEVKSFFISSQSAGTQNIFWNGRNNFNEQVTSGIYIYRFRAVSREGKNEVFEKSAKLIMLK